MTTYYIPAGELEYKNALSNVLHTGYVKDDRTGVGTVSIPGISMHFDVSKEAFPILLGKKVNFNALWTELLWIMSGNTTVAFLHRHNVHIWDEWADEETCAKYGRKAGDFGPTYGWQWRNFGEIYENSGWDEDYTAKHGTDQLCKLVDELQNNPFSRRLLLSAWHPYQAEQVELPPCITQIQLVSAGIYENVHYVDMIVTQRSGDMFLGIPFDISAHALLLCLLCDMASADTCFSPRKLHYNIGDAHIYLNHKDAVLKYLAQVCKIPFAYNLPKLCIDPSLRGKGSVAIDSLEFSSVHLEGYSHNPFIRAPIAK